MAEEYEKFWVDLFGSNDAEELNKLNFEVKPRWCDLEDVCDVASFKPSARKCEGSKSCFLNSWN